MDEAIDSTIGRRVRLIRLSRGKSLAVVAGLAGISPSFLSRLESGERSLDRRSLIVALANALQVAPSELTSLPVPAPGDGAADAAVAALRCKPWRWVCPPGRYSRSSSWPPGCTRCSMPSSGACTLRSAWCCRV